jgi:hypothetical protein
MHALQHSIAFHYYCVVVVADNIYLLQYYISSERRIIALSMSGNDDSLNVFCTITSDNGPRVPVTISKSSTPTELREKVSEATRIPLASLRLIFRGRMIKDDASSKVVDEYKVEPDCVLHCMGKPVVAVAVAVAADTTTTSMDVDATTSTTNHVAGPTVSVPTAAAASLPLPPAQDPLQAALQQLRANNAPSVYTTAVTTLEKVLSNIANHPMEDKYRKVKVQNAAFQKRLGGLTGGDAAMKAVGFYITTTSDGDQVYDLNASPEAWPKLMAATAVIGAAVQEAKRATQINAPLMPPSPAGMMGGMGGMPTMPAGLPNMPGGGMPANMNMNDPQMQSAMANMMSNPEALGSMLQVRKQQRISHMLYYIMVYYIMLSVEAIIRVHHSLSFVLF